MQRLSIVDSHTGGEPTRVLLSGGPDLGPSTRSLAERVTVFREHHDAFRSAVVNEPRGSDVLVGAMLVEPTDTSCVAGVIFFNNVGYLGMCGHGTIGVVATLAHLGRLRPGAHRLETCVGIVTATLHEDGSVSVANVPSHRKTKDVVVELPGVGEIKGDVAWGGNWFFLVEKHPWDLELSNLGTLTSVTLALRDAVHRAGHPEVDHVELFARGRCGGHSRNFVLCPGGAYDRSPCGTGTSAKLACLAADGKLAEGEVWIQESILGSTFRGSFRWENRAAGIVAPTVTGTAFVNAEATLLLNPQDPFCWGIRS